MTKLINDLETKVCTVNPYLKSQSPYFSTEKIIRNLNIFDYQAVLDFCNSELLRNDITSEMRKYLIGKKYRCYYIINSQTKSLNIQNAAKYIGNEYSVSGSLIIKYDLYARAIDSLYDKEFDLAISILQSKVNIPLDYVIKLSKMGKKDINYLKFLLGKNFYKAAGYIFMNTKLDINLQSITGENTALIKQMPAKDYDSMLKSLTYTIPSWINSITKTMSGSNISCTSATARNNLKNKLNDLKNIINEILIKIEANNNE